MTWVPWSALVAVVAAGAASGLVQLIPNCGRAGQAAGLALGSELLVLSGGPGSGKSHQILPKRGR